MNTYEDFLDYLEKVIPDGTDTMTSKNADEKITEINKEELRKIYEQSYENSYKIVKKLLEEWIIEKKSNTFPKLYREAIFYLVCKYCDEVSSKGAQNKVLNDLGLAHNTFTKWGLSPVWYFNQKRYDVKKAPKIEITRFGKKNDKLCEEFVNISSQISYSTFVDVFGGLGVITASNPKRGIEYLNDYDVRVFNFLSVIRNYPSQLIKSLENVFKTLYTDEHKYKMVKVTI